MRYALPLAAAVMAVVTAASLPLATAAMAQTAKPERVQFAKGKSAKTIKGTLKGDQSRLFVVNVRAGQTMTVKLTSTNASTYFNVTAPGAQQAMFIGSTSGNTMTEVIPSSGDYTIDLYMMRNAARRGETTSFTITIGATG
jgi:hypothetical protein